MYRTRALSLLGRVLLAKTCLCSLLQFQAETIVVPDWVTTTMQREIDRFIWHGQKRIAKDWAQQPIEKGGIGTNRLDTTARVAGIKWLLLAESNADKSWAKAIIEETSKIGGLNVLNGKVDLKEIQRSKMLPDIEYSFKCWSEIQKSVMAPQQASQNESLWMNKNLKHPRNSSTIFSKQLFKDGFEKVSDLFDLQGNIISAQTAIEDGLRPFLFAEWQTIKDSVQSRTGGRIQGPGTFNTRRRAEDEDHNFFIIAGNEINNFNKADKSLKKWIVENTRFKQNPFRA